MEPTRNIVLKLQAVPEWIAYDLDGYHLTRDETRARLFSKQLAKVLQPLFEKRLHTRLMQIEISEPQNESYATT